jgi:hypothetical protein
MKLYQDKAVEDRVYPAGAFYGLGYGVRKNYLEFEGVFSKASAKDDVNHDGVKNTMVHEESSLKFAMNFYLNKSFYARLGVGFYKVNQELGKDVSEASQEGAKKEFGLKEDFMTEGLTLGVGYVIYNSTKMAFFTQLERSEYSSLKASSWNLGLGFRYYL